MSVHSSPPLTINCYNMTLILSQYPDQNTPSKKRNDLISCLSLSLLVVLLMNSVMSHFG